MRRVHFTCPLCGRRATDSSLEKEFPVEFWLQEFGWFRGQPRPTMTWKKIAESSVIGFLRSALVRKLTEVAARFGYRLQPLLLGVSLVQRPDISVSGDGRLISIAAIPEVRKK